MILYYIQGNKYKGIVINSYNRVLLDGDVSVNILDFGYIIIFKALYVLTLGLNLW